MSCAIISLLIIKAISLAVRQLIEALQFGLDLDLINFNKVGTLGGTILVIGSVPQTARVLPHSLWLKLFQVRFEDIV